MTTPLVVAVERTDDIPLLLSQMNKIQLSKLLDDEFPMHGNWAGLGLGEIVEVWLAYILSEGDHRLNHVESWAEGLLITLNKCLHSDVCALDFSDDRLAKVLDSLGLDDNWDRFEVKLGQNIIRTYDLKPKRARVDSTTAKSYRTTVTDDGLFQFGHSKDHRPDLPQLKINQSALDPLGIPLTTTIVSGEKSDDPLYIPEIKKVQKIINTKEVLFVGDCKMASIATRTYVVRSDDYYLCPLSSVQMPASSLAEILSPVWINQQQLIDIYQPNNEVGTTQQKIAEGFSFTITLQDNLDEDGETFEWEEQKLVVRSLKHAAKQEKKLLADIDKAQKEINKLNKTGRGIKRLNKNTLEASVEAVIKKHKLFDLLDIEYGQIINEKEIPANRKRAAYILQDTIPTVKTTIDTVALANAIRHLGWRVFVCNDKELTLSEAVMAYRQEYLIEHGFARYKGKALGLTPIYLSSETRIKGLIRLLSIGLRVLCLLEFTVRKALKSSKEKLSGIYKGNPKRSTASPSAEMMLKNFRGISLIVININGKKHTEMTSLTAVQERILLLSGIPRSIYIDLGKSAMELPNELGER